MNELFRAVSDRLKALFTAHAALELEAELIIRHVERKALLLRQAAQLEQEGMNDLAAELRKHAGAMDVQQPAQGLLPAPASVTDNPAAVPDDVSRSEGGRKKQRSQPS